MRTPLVGDRVEQLLHHAQLALAPDERRLEPRRRALAAPCGHDAERAPERHRLGLALELVLAGVRIHDRRLARPPRRLADEHGARLGRRLDPRGGVDEIARDHALPFRAERDGGLAGEHAGACLRARRRARDRRDQLERGAHGALGVVLLRDRRAPHGHHGVADELLDRAAVALDRSCARVEVAGEQLARVLRIAALGRGREADEVGEEDGDEPALRLPALQPVPRWAGVAAAPAPSRTRRRT